MNAKQYLQQNENLEELCKAKIAQIAELREMAKSIKLTMGGGERVQSSMKTPDRTAELICNIIILEEQLEKEVKELIKKKKEITDKINSLHSNECKLVLNLRYLNLMTFLKMAEEMNKSFPTVLKMHKRALRNFEKTHFEKKPFNQEEFEKTHWSV